MQFTSFPTVKRGSEAVFSNIIGSALFSRNHARFMLGFGDAYVCTDVTTKV